MIVTAKVLETQIELYNNKCKDTFELKKENAEYVIIKRITDYEPKEVTKEVARGSARELWQFMNGVGYAHDIENIEENCDILAILKRCAYNSKPLIVDVEKIIPPPKPTIRKFLRYTIKVKSVMDLISPKASSIPLQVTVQVMTDSSCRSSFQIPINVYLQPVMLQLTPKMFKESIVKQIDDIMEIFVASNPSGQQTRCAGNPDFIANVTRARMKKFGWKNPALLTKGLNITMHLDDGRVW